MKLIRRNPFESAPIAQNNEWQTTMPASNGSWLVRTLSWWPFVRTSRDRSASRANAKSRIEADERADQTV